MLHTKYVFLLVLALWATALRVDCATPKKADSNVEVRVGGVDVPAWHYINLGYDKLKKSDSREAFRMANLALQKDQNNGAAYVLRGIARNDLEENKFALEDLNQGIALDPKQLTANVWEIYGKLYWKTKQYDKALAAATKAVALGHDGVYTYRLRERAAMYEFLNQPKKALADLNEAIKINPKERDSYVQRATIYKEGKQWNLVIPDATRVIEFSERDKMYDSYWSRALAVRASAYDAIGRKDLAKRDNEKIDAQGKGWLEDMMGK